MKKYILGFLTAVLLFSVYAFNAESRIENIDKKLGEVSQKLSIGSAWVKDTLTSDLVFSGDIYPKDSLLFKGQGNYAICDYQDNMLIRFRPGSSDIRFANNFDVYLSNLVTTDIINSGNTSLTGNLTVGKRLHTPKGADVASASAITLGDGNYFHITGTTTIANITTTDWVSGDRIYLYFDNTLTLTNGGAGAGHFALNGATDFTSSSGDIITLVLDGTVWYQVAPASVN